MTFDKIFIEWKECRDTIAKFDSYLLRLRLTGFSVFTLLFTAITGVAGKQDSLASYMPEALFFSIVTLSLFVVGIYMLDRYYERMLLVAVLRASRLEAFRLGDFHIGLTTEIEFQKEQMDKKSFQSKLFKASNMVNFVYILILTTMWAQYYALSSHYISGVLMYNIVLGIIIVIVLGLIFIGHYTLKEPSRLIGMRSKIVQSPIVISVKEIQHMTMKLSEQIEVWLKGSNINKLCIISILPGARRFTEDLLANLEKRQPGIEMTVHPVRLQHNFDKKTANRCQLIHGCLDFTDYSTGAILIIDALLDTGITMDYVKEHITKIESQNIKSVALIKKYIECETEVDYLGYNLGLSRKEINERGIDDYWIFGYGMDIDDLYSEFEYIGWVEMNLK